MDVGTTERQLQKIFNLAKSWGCVLLLDEADVFLAKRTRDDMLRNGFVSVFLRLLEYYEGIIFLTTNRIEEFDPAFQSRIHLRLAYSDLDAQKRTNIWRNLLGAAESCTGWGSEVFEGLGRDLILNGREIKNLIRTALAISSHRGRALELADLTDVYELNYASGNGMLGPSTFGPAVGITG
jgi:SpoVK/Ycf46/Vps4 family AAA+-type ATPase